MSMRKTVQLDVQFHQGKTIMDTARTYANLLKVLLEVVQNGIDSGARRIELRVNQQKRTFTVYDNGSGCGLEKFQKALRSLNSTMKDESRYGQFGRGLVAPLSVSEDGFTFTSCEQPHRAPYFTYYFNPKKIEAQSMVKIDGEERPDLSFDADGKVWWRTAVEAKKLTRDRRLAALTLRQLLDEIAIKFGETIRSREILISIAFTDAEGESDAKNVTAPEYNGERLEIADFTGKESGKITLELYLARLGRNGRKGRVVVGTTTNPSRISMPEFMDNARGGLLRSEVGHGLNSGIFEGKILCQNLKLNPDRTRFEDTEALAELCLHLEDWWEKKGKPIMADLREQDDDSRFQRLGTSVMPYAELLLRQDRFKTVAESIQVGTVGRGHAAVEETNILGPDKGTSIGIDGGPFDEKDPKPRKGGGSGEGGKPPPKKDHPKHTPGPVYGPRGHRRTEVMGSSTGLRFAYVEMVNTSIPFTFEPATGTLTFNLDHPDWAKCEDADGALQRYQIAVIGTALSLELYRNGSRAISQELVEFAHAGLQEQVFAIMNGDAMLKK